MALLKTVTKLLYHGFVRTRFPGPIEHLKGPYNSIAEANIATAGYRYPWMAVIVNGIGRMLYKGVNATDADLKKEADGEGVIRVIPVAYDPNPTTGQSLELIYTAAGGASIVSLDRDTGAWKAITIQAGEFILVSNGAIIGRSTQEGFKFKMNSGAGAPAYSPTFIGEKYIDTAAKKSYEAMGTTSAADWVILN